MKFIRFLEEIYKDRPGSQTIHAFNRSLSAAGVKGMQHHPSARVTNIARHLDNGKILRNILQLPRRAYIVAMMWPKEARLFPVCFWGEVIPLCFDCWPSDYDVWENIFKRHKIKIAFFTARQSRDYFRKRLPRMKSCWLPEAADPLEYDGKKTLDERDIDVLELGRRSQKYHNFIREGLNDAGCTHLYVQEGQRRMFPTRNELMHAWANTKISVCFSKSVTNPERSGGVETVTFRYFESMASRCLPVGCCPSELSDIFGYNPVVEVDWQNPSEQIVKILANIEIYQELVDRNYKRMLEVGSWDTRVSAMLAVLEKDGYGA